VPTELVGSVMVERAAVARPGGRPRAPGRNLRPVNVAWLCVISGLGLSVLGVYGIDVAESVQRGGGLSPTAMKQLLFLTLGLAAAAVVAIPHYRVYGRLSWPAYAGLAALLVFLLIPAVPRWLVEPQNGARAWINLGPFNFQPSEVGKVIYVAALAWYLRFRRHHRRFTGLLPPALITAIPVGLITLQPDLGTAILFVPALFAVLLAAGARLRHLLVVVLLAGLAAPAAYPLLRPHQQARIDGLMKQFRGDRSADQDINMQSRVAQRLIAAGGWDGVGDAKSRALVRYNALPERHNDMVFAVLVNRFGALGGLAIVGGLVLWVTGALLTAGLTRDPFGRLLVVGLAGFVAAQGFVNLGMNLGVLPIIGVTLPFVSYGGSSLITTWIMTGIVFGVALRPPKPPVRAAFDHFEEDE
jgi:cell division protein FtsW (lipid II flippase)